jgi:hypothetical protein
MMVKKRIVERRAGWRRAVPLVGLLLIAGCGETRPSEQDLGKLIYQLPELPGSDQRYPLPSVEAAGAAKPADAAPPTSTGQRD